MNNEEDDYIVIVDDSTAGGMPCDDGSIHARFCVGGLTLEGHIFPHNSSLTSNETSIRVIFKDGSELNCTGIVQVDRDCLLKLNKEEMAEYAALRLRGIL